MLNDKDNKKKLTKEYINNEIKKCYPTEDVAELAERLGITITNLRSKARRLGVSRAFVNDIVGGRKVCACCKQMLPVSAFRVDKYQRSNLDYYCKECRQKTLDESFKAREKLKNCINNSKPTKFDGKVDLGFHKGKKRNHPFIDINGVEVLICKSCERAKPLTTEFFYQDKKSSHGFKNYCKCCEKKLKKARTAKAKAEQNLKAMQQSLLDDKKGV